MRRVFALVGLLLVSVVLSACTGGSDDPEPEPTSSAADACSGEEADGTDFERSLTIGDTTWKYLVHVPPNYDASTPLPVVYLFHGLAGEAALNLAYTEFQDAANEDEFVVVAPQANGSPSTWDVVTPVTTEGSDVDFALQLTQEIAKDWCVDADRQFAAGISNGSALVFAMACSGAFDMKAYGGVAAAFYEEPCTSAPPASIVYFHGTADPTVPFDGGPTPLFPVRAVPDIMDDWAEHDGCDPDPRGIPVGKDVEHTIWRGCDKGARLETYIIENGGHTWPGALFPVVTLGSTTATVSATDAMVDFFGIGGAAGEQQ